MFKIDLSPTIRWPVTVILAGTTGEEKAEFAAVFARRGQSYIRDLMQRIAAGEAVSDADLVQAELVGWDGITYEGNPVEYSAEALEKVLDIPGAALAIARAALRCMSEAASKN